MKVSDAYALALQRLMEKPGAEVIVNFQSFLRIFTGVLFDFCSKTGICKNVVNFRAISGASRYSINPAPGEAPGTDAGWGTGAWGVAEWGVGASAGGEGGLFKFMSADQVYWSGRHLKKISVHDLAVMDRSWESRIHTPQYWNDDSCPVEHIEIYPVPDKSGDNVSPSYGDFVVTGGNFSVVGTELPVSVSISMNDEIPFVPVSAVQYLVWGAVRDLIKANNELRDDQRALYADARYREGVAIYSIIMKSEMGE